MKKFKLNICVILTLLIGILVFFVFIAIIGSSGNNDEPKKAQTSTPTQNVRTPHLKCMLTARRGA